MTLAPFADIATILVEQEGILTADQIGAVQREAARTGEAPVETVVRLGLLDEEELLQALSRRLSLPYVSLDDQSVSPEAIAAVPAKWASHFQVVPIFFDGDVLVVAVSNPFDYEKLDDLRLVLDRPIRLALAGREAIAKAHKRFYGVGAETVEGLLAAEGATPALTAQRAEEDGDLSRLDAATEASVAKYVQQLLLEAIRERATDVHLEPFEDSFRIRYRIDGFLHETSVPAGIRHFHPAIVSRIKVMANLNIAEKRLPQDGRINVSVGSEQFDLRVSVLPTGFGEAVNIRILSRSTSFLTLEELGLREAEQATVEGLIRMPHGIILLTGPTGSGKTTSLYAFLSRINTPEKKILTIEDPVEYRIPGVIQMQVHPEIDFRFSRALRHMLRHDPDVMMVGEIRDEETAQITIRTALTGHLVFSTLHTNDAAGAISRLLDMGVEPYLAASSIEAIIAQRLVRKICPRCQAPLPDGVSLPEGLREFLRRESDVRLLGGSGCEYCRFTGYRGRTGIFEILLVDDDIRELAMKRAPSGEIKQRAREKGMHTLWEDGASKVAEGTTTAEELLRVTQDAGLAWNAGD